MPAEFTKSCWWCVNSRYENGDSGAREGLPGDQFYIKCEVDVWRFDSETTSQQEFGEIFEMAETCEKFRRLI